MTKKHGWFHKWGPWQHAGGMGYGLYQTKRCACGAERVRYSWWGQ